MPAPSTARTMKPKQTTRKNAKPRLTLAQAMALLEKAGSAQTRKTYARHVGSERAPMFGVSFATLKELKKRIGVDHELALALWDTGNLDARNLAAKIVDPAQMRPAELDRWARESNVTSTWGGYVGMIAGEGPHAIARAERWLASKDLTVRCVGWSLIAHVAQRRAELPDQFFSGLVERIERAIGQAHNLERAAMNLALIAIGSRSAGLRKEATAAARRIGTLEIDHGDTSCKTPDAVATLEKAWAWASSKGQASPAALERTRETPRTRC